MYRMMLFLRHGAGAVLAYVAPEAMKTSPPVRCSSLVSDEVMGSSVKWTRGVQLHRRRGLTATGA